MEAPAPSAYAEPYDFTMRLDHEPLTDETLDEVVAFIRRSNPFAQNAWGWDIGRFMDWRWGINTVFEATQPGWFSKHCTVFREGPAISAVSIAEYGAEHRCIITTGEDSAAVRWALDWLMSARRDLGLRFDFSDTESWLRDLLATAGFAETPNTGIDWEYDLATVADVAPVPAGFTIESLAGDPTPDYPGIAECIQAAFGSDFDHLPGLRSLESNPMFRPELSVVARSPDGRIAAYCRGVVDPDTGVCSIDPVCCHPDFQRRGLSKAIVQSCFQTQRDLGGRFSYIGSAPEPAPGTYLYRSLGPSSVNTLCAWSLNSTET